MKIAIAVVGICALCAGAWFFFGSRALIGSENIEPAAQRRDAVVEKAVFTGSVRELLARPGAWECAVSSNAGSVTTEGNAYVAGGKVRGDFSSVVPQVGSVASHIIIRDGRAYTWTSMTNQGLMFPVGVAEGEAEVSDAVSAPLTNDYRFECQVWIPTESTFALPSGITF